jgi:hypothetical protein
MSYIRERSITIIVVKSRHTAASKELAQQQCQQLAGINIPRRWATCASTDVGPATLDQEPVRWDAEQMITVFKFEHIF